MTLSDIGAVLKLPKQSIADQSNQKHRNQLPQESGCKAARQAAIGTKRGHPEIQAPTRSTNLRCDNDSLKPAPASGTKPHTTHPRQKS